MTNLSSLYIDKPHEIREKMTKGVTNLSGVTILAGGYAKFVRGGGQICQVKRIYKIIFKRLKD